jgi:hypothetical protein
MTAVTLLPGPRTGCGVGRLWLQQVFPLFAGNGGVVIQLWFVPERVVVREPHSGRKQ